MTKNRLLNVVILLCRFCKILCVVLFVALSALFIHIQIDSDYYKALNIQIKGGAEVGVSMTDTWKLKGQDVPRDENIFRLDKLTLSSLYIQFIRYTAILVFIFLCFKEFQLVVESVTKTQTFIKRNVTSFVRLGKYLFMLFLLYSYSIFVFEQGKLSIINIAFIPFVMMLLSFVLAEIFKEGNQLSEENELTV